MMTKPKCPICKKATNKNYYRQGASGKFISHNKSVYCSVCKTVYILHKGEIQTEKYQEFDLEDIIIFVTDKKLRQRLERRVVSTDIEYFLDRLANNKKDRPTADRLIRFVNEFLREQQA